MAGVRSNTLLVLQKAALLSARCCFAASAVFLCFWLLFVGPLTWRLNGEYNASPAAKSIYNKTAVYNVELRNLVFLWLTPSILALSALMVLVLQPLVKQQLGTSGPPVLGSSWLSQLLPPRGFWMWWCNGLTVLDLLIICLWAAINASWLSATINAHYKRALLKAVQAGLAVPPGEAVAKAVARGFGYGLAPNLCLLFYPVTRGSVVLQVLGLSYPSAIRYHRWLGYGVLTLVAVHGITYWGVWINTNTFAQQAFEQGPSHNNLMGSIALLFSLALWVTAVGFSRRTNYAVFKTIHHIGFWGFMVCGCCHKFDLIWYFLPGMMLYGIDGVYRLHQAVLERAAGSTVQVLHASVSSGGSLCSLVLSAPHLGAAASGFLWLYVPTLSWHYHPFEYIAVPWPTADPTTGRTITQTALLVHIKGYNGWTKQLLALVASKGKDLALKIQGPYSELPGPVVGHPEVSPADGNCQKNQTPDSVIIIAGGNGISPATAVLQELAGAASTGLPTLLVWCCRTAEELEVLGPVVMAMAHTLRLQLTTKFYFTGKSDGAAATAAKSQHKQPASIIAADSASSELDTAIAIADVHGQVEAPSAVGSVSGGGIATTSLCPVVALGNWWAQAGHKLIMHLVVPAGVLCALILGRYITFVQPGKQWPTAQTGATYVALLISFILAPGLLTLWATLLVWKSEQKAKLATASKNSGISQNTPDGETSTVSAAAAAAAAAELAGSKGILAGTASGSLHLQLAGLPTSSTGNGQACAAVHPGAELLTIPIEAGRPPLPELVKGWLATVRQLPAAPGSGGSSSGRVRCNVYAMGPGKLVQSVQVLCNEVVGVNFVRKTHEM